MNELWFGMSHYFLGMIVIFSLLVALMEASRKYDRFRETSYLLQAIGYFFLLVWALLFAMLLGQSPLLIVSSVTQVVGLICLAAGYYIYHHAHPFADYADDEPDISHPTLKKQKGTTVNDESLVALLSAPEKSVAGVELVKAEKTTEALVLPNPKKKSAKGEEQEETVDLSYLSGRSDIGNASNKKKTITKKERVTLMNDLFPLPKEGAATPVTKPPDITADITADVTADITSNATDKNDKLPGEKLGAFLPFTPAFMSFNLSVAWVEMSVVLATLFIVLLLIPQRNDRGSRYLLAGFSVICGASLLSAFINPQLLGNIPSSSAEIFALLPLRILQVVGFSLLGLAGWVRIKGKVTHHFLRIVSFVYIVLLLLTIGLAVVIVKDINTLQLLLVLMTGVLMTILPIIHSLTYSHPDHHAGAVKKDANE